MRFDDEKALGRLSDEGLVASLREQQGADHRRERLGRACRRICRSGASESGPLIADRDRLRQTVAPISACRWKRIVGPHPGRCRYAYLQRDCPTGHPADVHSTPAPSPPPPAQPSRPSTSALASDPAMPSGMNDVDGGDTGRG